MSKSQGNVILLSDTKEAVEKKVRSMYTDPNRIRADVPGKVKGNPVFIYHDAFNLNTDEVLDLKSRYLKGRVGDVEVKGKLSKAINLFLEPIRNKRRELEGNKKKVEEILHAGNERMRQEARNTMTLVHEAMGFDLYR